MRLRIPKMPLTNLKGSRAKPKSVKHGVLATIALLAIAVTVPKELEGQGVHATEAEVKAAFLFHFGKYVNWPRIPGDHFTICVLGRDPFGPALGDIVAGENISGKPVGVRVIRTVQEASTCQTVFISASEQAQSQAILASLSQLPVLTVSDLPHFTERGGMIQFVTDKDRIRFVVNLTAAQKRGLGLSSELLKVAKAVHRDNGSGEM